MAKRSPRNSTISEVDGTFVRITITLDDGSKTIVSLHPDDAVHLAHWLIDDAMTAMMNQPSFASPTDTGRTQVG